MALVAPARPRSALSAWSRAAALGSAAVAVEWGRVLASRLPGASFGAMVAGGVLLCLLARGSSASDLGLGRGHIARRLFAGIAIGAVLLLPAVMRGAALPGLPAGFMLPAALVAIGEEVAFRGALFAALLRAGGPAAAVGGSSAAFVLAHVLSHPPSFLPAVAALGLLLGLWRWACRDLVAPITAHVLADLAL